MSRKGLLLKLGIMALTMAVLNYTPALSAGTIYVDVDAAGAATGASWTDAYTTLQDALAAATSGDQIWVAGGVYYPDEGAGVVADDRTESFTLVDGVLVYGGFAGGESSLSERDWETNVTVLSGDIDQDDTTDADGVVTDPADISGSNAYHVITADGVGSGTVLDGFTITAGNADGVSPHDLGGGMHNISSATPQLIHLVFSGNKANTGGGMSNVPASPSLTLVSFIHNEATGSGGGMWNNTSDPVMVNVQFIGNVAGVQGGGMVNQNSSPSVSDSSFSGNSAPSGGGVLNYLGSPTFSRVVFRGNEASTFGGAMNNTQSNVMVEGALFSGNTGTANAGAVINYLGAPEFINATFTGNKTPNHGGAMYNNTVDTILTNVIMWNDDGGGITDDELYNSGSTPIISHSNIAGSGGSASWNSSMGTDAGGNLDVDPQFTTPLDPSTAPSTAGDFHLPYTSPMLERGYAYNCPAQDLDGTPRPQGGDCDIGAYELAANEPPGLSLLINRSPAAIVKGSGPSGPNQWFTRLVPANPAGTDSVAFHYVVWLHIPQDWALPWSTQYSFTGDFANTTLSPDWAAQSWVQDLNNCPFGGLADSGYKWRAFSGPLEALPIVGNRLNNQVNLRGGLGIPSGETTGLYGGVRMLLGSYYDFDMNGTPDRYRCDEIAVTNISVTD